MDIPYGRQSVDETDIQAVVDVLRGDRITQGPAVEAFEAALARACDVPFAVAFSSGTAALHGAAFAAGLGSGDDLVTSALTFAASANCGVYLGARPVFADIDPKTWNVSGRTLAAACTPATKAVVPVHFAGLPAPVAEIRRALSRDIRIIEDAAHALGAIADGEPVGCCRQSDMTVFSFHPVKAITTGEGGMVTTRDPELKERLLRFRNHGFVRDGSMRRRDEGAWYYEQHELGFNYRLTDIHSALGRSQLDKLERFIERRNQVAERYREGFANCESVELPPPAPPGSRHAYHLFVVLHRGGAEGRRRLYEGLRSIGILGQVHYLPPYLHPFYADTYGYHKGLCPQAERYYSRCLSLPCFPALDAATQDRVITAVRELAVG